jgi:ABC-type polysaccharide/polyol phosphate export permease
LKRGAFSFIGCCSGNSKVSYDTKPSHHHLKGRFAMFQPRIRKTHAGSAFGMLAVIFFTAVQQVRKSHRVAIIGLFSNIVQLLVLIGVFYFVMYLLGSGGARIRGDRFVYTMSGIIMYVTHIKTISAVSGADGPTSAMMQHSPMNTIVAISAAALSTLYQQVFAVGVILYGYHCAVTPVTIDQPVGTFCIFLLSWVSGIAIGLILRSVTPWAPALFGILATVYKRANVIASGKMMVANATPAYILQYFDWNPLFHIVDQGRGFIFLNYFPHHSSIAYPVKITVVCFIVGLMCEYYTRKYQSASWGARG